MLHPQLQQPMLYHPQQLQQQALPVINCTLLRQLSRHVKSKPCVSHAGKALIDSLGCKAGSWYTSNSNSWSIYRTPGSKQPFYSSCDDQCAAAPLSCSMLHALYCSKFLPQQLQNPWFAYVQPLCRLLHPAYGGCPVLADVMKSVNATGCHVHKRMTHASLAPTRQTCASWFVCV